MVSQSTCRGKPSYNAFALGKITTWSGHNVTGDVQQLQILGWGRTLCADFGLRPNIRSFYPIVSQRTFRLETRIAHRSTDLSVTQSVERCIDGSHWIEIFTSNQVNRWIEILFGDKLEIICKRIRSRCGIEGQTVIKSCQAMLLLLFFQKQTDVIKANWRYISCLSELKKHIYPLDL